LFAQLGFIEKSKEGLGIALIVIVNPIGVELQVVEELTTVIVALYVPGVTPFTAKDIGEGGRAVKPTSTNPAASAAASKSIEY
jgi:hypothetical protein